MAWVDGVLFGKVSGALAKEIVFKQYGGKTFVSKYPDMSKRVLSPKQIENTRRMAAASFAARQIMADETLRNAAQIRLNIPSNRLYTTLIKEYFANGRTEED